jgi:NAD(P)-dependent dehydrogenase (short-subunit alcohol dehydrogenase family)
LQLNRHYNGWVAYAQSKLANVLLTYELARRLAGSQVTANVVHPGYVATYFGLNNGWFTGWSSGPANSSLFRPSRASKRLLIWPPRPMSKG